MKRLTYSLAVLFVAAIAFAIGGEVALAADTPAPAPGAGPGGGGNGGGGGGGRRGGFDPAQMMQRFQERVGATDDEWKVIQPRIQKVMELQPRPGGMFGGGGRRGGNGGPGAPGGAAPDAQAGGQGGQGGPGRGMFGGTPVPEAEALQKVLDNKDSTNDQIKAATKTYRDAMEKRDKELQKARQDLREVLSVRQEAQLVLMRILD